MPISYVELYTAQAQRTVDGGNQTFINLQAATLFEVQKYVTVTNYLYNPQILLMSKKIYDKLNADGKKVLNEVAAEARDYQRQLSQKYSADAYEFLKGKLAINTLPPEEIARMKEKSKPLIQQATGGRTLRRLLCPHHCVGRFFRPYAGE